MWCSQWGIQQKLSGDIDRIRNFKIISWAANAILDFLCLQNAFESGMGRNIQTFSEIWFEIPWKKSRVTMFVLILLRNGWPISIEFFLRIFSKFKNWILFIFQTYKCREVYIRIIIIFYFFPLCSFKNTYKPKFLLFHNQRLPLNSHVSNFIIFFPIHNNNLYYFSSNPVHPINTTE